VKAYLLAAGEGRRLRPVTDTIPKCLVPVQGTPLLGIWLRLLEGHGVTHVLVNVHHFHEQVTAFLAKYPTSMTIETVYEPRLLGSAGTVLANRGFVQGEPCFLIAYADNLTNVDLQEMVRFHRNRSETLTLGVTITDRPREKGTVMIRPDGQVIDFAEKAAEPKSNLANAGIYVANQGLFDYLPVSPPTAGVLDFGHDVLPRMVPHVAAYRIDQFLMDIGTPEAYTRAQEIWPGLPGSPPVTA
jgi:mannose-1-phosphate guanylyltransferase